MNTNLRVRVLVVHEGRLLLLPPSQSAEDGGCWTLPGGGLEAGETLAGCAAREMREETGLDAQIGDVAFLRERPWIFRTVGQPEETGLCLEVYFHAILLSQNATPRAENVEGLPPRWVPFAEARRLPLWPAELPAQVDALLHGVAVSGAPCYPLD